jgi:hypothetical protein
MFGNAFFFSKQLGELWTPIEISTALWLDASDISTITKDGNNRVSEWRDKSGNNRHAVQPTTAGRPVHQTNKILFEFKAMESPFIKLNEFSYFIVYKRLGSPSSNTGFICDIGVVLATSPTGRISQTSYNDNTFRVSHRANAIIEHTRNDNTNIHFASHKFGNDGFVTYNINDTLINSVSTIVEQITLTTPPVFRIGHGSTWSSTLANLPYNSTNIASYIELSEIIALPIIPTESEKEKMQGYLAHKWGLTANLPSDHPYKNFPPTI